MEFSKLLSDCERYRTVTGGDPSVSTSPLSSSYTPPARNPQSMQDSETLIQIAQEKKIVLQPAHERVNRRGLYLFAEVHERWGGEDPPSYQHLTLWFRGKLDVLNKPRGAQFWMDLCRWCNQDPVPYDDLPRNDPRKLSIEHYFHQHMCGNSRTLKHGLMNLQALELGFNNSGPFKSGELQVKIDFFGKMTFNLHKKWLAWIHTDKNGQLPSLAFLRSSHCPSDLFTTPIYISSGLRQTGMFRQLKLGNCMGMSLRSDSKHSKCENAAAAAASRRGLQVAHAQSSPPPEAETGTTEFTGLLIEEVTTCKEQSNQPHDFSATVATAESCASNSGICYESTVENSEDEDWDGGFDALEMPEKVRVLLTRMEGNEWEDGCIFNVDSKFVQNMVLGDFESVEEQKLKETMLWYRGKFLFKLGSFFSRLEPTSKLEMRLLVEACTLFGIEGSTIEKLEKIAAHVNRYIAWTDIENRGEPVNPLSVVRNMKMLKPERIVEMYDNLLFWHSSLCTASSSMIDDFEQAEQSLTSSNTTALQRGSVPATADVNNTRDASDDCVSAQKSAPVAKQTANKRKATYDMVTRKQYEGLKLKKHRSHLQVRKKRRSWADFEHLPRVFDNRAGRYKSHPKCWFIPVKCPHCGIVFRVPEEGFNKAKTAACLSHLRKCTEMSSDSDQDSSD